MLGNREYHPPAPRGTVSVNKLTWAQVGGITEPGRYMFRFGWLTITADDLAVWERFPNASFVLVSSGLFEGAAEDSTRRV